MTSHNVLAEDVTDEFFMNLVAQLGEAVAQFLGWAAACLAEDRPLRLRDREDLAEARTMASEFDEPWWGIVVYTCFGAVQGARRVGSLFGVVPPPGGVEDRLARLKSIMVSGDVGRHRIQPGHKGARTALRSACDNAESFRSILCGDEGGFDQRYRGLLGLDIPQWRRTTCFDLMLRTGWLGVPGRRIEPEVAYLRGSQGPRAGFEQVFGITVSASNAAYCEGLLQAWTRNWDDVSRFANVRWDGDGFTPGDFENVLCIYQEPLKPEWPNPAAFA